MKDIIIAIQPYATASLAGLLCVVWKSDTWLNVMLKLSQAALTVISLFVIFWGLS